MMARDREAHVHGRDRGSPPLIIFYICAHALLLFGGPAPGTDRAAWIAPPPPPPPLIPILIANYANYYLKGLGGSCYNNSLSVRGVITQSRATSQGPHPCPGSPHANSYLIFTAQKRTY